MKTKFFALIAAAIVLVTAVPSFSQCPSQLYTETPTQIFAGPYTQGDAIVFRTSVYAWYYFNLTGTEASREMASILKLAYAKSKKITFSLTNNTMPGLGWKEVCSISVTN